MVIRRRTPKRLSQEAEYKKICDEIDEEAIAKGEFRCFFCNTDIRKHGPYGHHHLRGRTGLLLTDKRYIVIAGNSCHGEYDSLPVKKQKWREGFLERLREKDLKTYFKEREKENK